MCLFFPYRKFSQNPCRDLCEISVGGQRWENPDRLKSMLLGHQLFVLYIYLSGKGVLFSSYSHNIIFHKIISIWCSGWKWQLREMSISIFNSKLMLNSVLSLHFYINNTNIKFMQWTKIQGRSLNLLGFYTISFTCMNWSLLNLRNLGSYHKWEETQDNILWLVGMWGWNGEGTVYGCQAKANIIVSTIVK